MRIETDAIYGFDVTEILVKTIDGDHGRGPEKFRKKGIA